MTNVIHRNEKIKGYDLRMCLASRLRFQPLEKKYVPRPQTWKGHLPSPRCDPTLWCLWRGGRRRCKSVSARQKEPPGASSLDATCSQGVLLRVSNCLTRAPKKRKREKNTTGSVQGFIFWTVNWRRSRYRGRCRSPSSCWRFAAGGGRSSAMMPDLSQCGRPPAMFHSSGLFAGGPCCLIHARSFSLAWRRA